MLVATLSTDWGFYRTPAGKAVYFTLASQGDLEESGDHASRAIPTLGAGVTRRTGHNSQNDPRSLARFAASGGRSWP